MLTARNAADSSGTASQVRSTQPTWLRVDNQGDRADRMHSHPRGGSGLIEPPACCMTPHGCLLPALLQSAGGRSAVSPGSKVWHQELDHDRSRSRGQECGACVCCCTRLVSACAHAELACGGQHATQLLAPPRCPPDKPAPLVKARSRLQLRGAAAGAAVLIDRFPPFPCLHHHRKAVA